MAQKLVFADHPNLYVDPKSGIFYVRAMVNGKAVTRSTGLATKKKAILRLHEIIGELQDEKLGWSSKDAPTLAEWWTAYRKATKKAPTTWERDEQIMNQHVLPQFGKARLNDITQNQMGNFLQWRRRKVSEGTVSREQALLRAVFEAAIDSDVLEKNPLRKIPHSRPKFRTRVVLQEEQAKLESVMTPLLKRWFLFLLGTGIRVSEARGIDPATDIDWAGKRVRVVGKGSKERWVPLLPQIADRLLELLRDQIEDNERYSRWHRSKRKGTLWNQSVFGMRKRLYLDCDKVGIPRFGPHTLRHTFATRYLKGGGDIYILSRILGHSSVGVTQQHYAHLLTEDLAARSSAVGGIL